MAEKTLVVIQGITWFEFYFKENHDKKWIVRCYPDNNNKEKFSFEMTDGGRLISDVLIPYRKFGVSGIRSLFKLFMLRPEEVIQKLIGERVKISSIKVEQAVGYKNFGGCPPVSDEDQDNDNIENIKLENEGSSMSQEIGEQDDKKSYKMKVDLKDDKYPYIVSNGINLTWIGSIRGRGKVVYISDKLVTKKGYLRYLEFKRVGQIGLELDNARIIRTEKGTLVIKYEPGSKLYIIEIPSGFRGKVRYKLLQGECYEAISKPGTNQVLHLFCNGDAEIVYEISGRTRTAGYGELRKIFGEGLVGIIRVKGGEINVDHDVKLVKLLS